MICDAVRQLEAPGEQEVGKSLGIGRALRKNTHRPPGIGSEQDHPLEAPSKPSGQAEC